MYLCVLTNDAGCLYTQRYQLRLPPYYESISEAICEGENYAFGSQFLTQSGLYERLIEAKDGCDSIIQLDLKVIPTTKAELFDSFCEGESWSYYGFNTDIEGEFQITLINANGCDSLVTVNLTEIPPGKGILLQDTIELNLGEKLDLIPVSVDPGYSTFKWTGPNGSFLGDEPVMYNILPTQTGYYHLTGEDEYGCPVSDSSLVFVRTNSYRLTLPNVFSPNGDHLNDRFEPAFPGSVDQIKRMVIYDRWGNKVFEGNNISVSDENWGWDGIFRGLEAATGVYTYLMEVMFIDGHENKYTGDVTLLR
jgi:gliding motility-associated-like protein